MTGVSEVGWRFAWIRERYEGIGGGQQREYRPSGRRAALVARSAAAAKLGTAARQLGWKKGFRGQLLPISVQKCVPRRTAQERCMLARQVNDFWVVLLPPSFRSAWLCRGPASAPGLLFEMYVCRCRDVPRWLPEFCQRALEELQERPCLWRVCQVQNPPGARLRA